jgi:hypothetical protein
MLATMRVTFALAVSVVSAACAKSLPPAAHPTDLADDAGAAESPEPSPPSPTPATSEVHTLTFALKEDDAQTISSDERYGVDLVVRAERGSDGVGRTTDVVIETRNHVTFETLGANPVPRYRVTFGDAYLAKIHDGRQTRSDLPIAGKTYRVTLTERKAFITDDKGGHIPREEGKLLAQRFAGYAAKKEALVRFASEPHPMGARSAALESLLRADFAGAVEVVSLDGLTATLNDERAVDGVLCGVFDIGAHVVLRTEQGWTMANELYGKVYVRTTDSGIARSELTGQVQLTGSTLGVDVKAEGHAVLNAVHTYSRGVAAAP